MIKRLVIIIIIIIISVTSVFAFSKSRILNMKDIKVLPAIVKNNDVYIQFFKGVNNKNQYYLLGNDGKTYEIKIKNAKASNYKINWGYGNKEAILLTGVDGKIPNGNLVAIGNDIKDIIEWKPAKKEIRNCNLSDSITKSNIYKVREKYCYIVSAVRGKLFYISEEKESAKYDQCDNQTFRRVLGIINEDGINKIIANYYEDCDGQSQDKDNYFPLGSVLGALVIKDKSKKEIWLVMKVHGYENVGIGYVKLYPEENLSKNIYEYDITDEL